MQDLAGRSNTDHASAKYTILKYSNNDNTVVKNVLKYGALGQGQYSFAQAQRELALFRHRQSDEDDREAGSGSQQLVACVEDLLT